MTSEHVVREVRRKFAMEDVFWMDKDFKTQVCLWAPSCPINLTQFWNTNSGLAWIKCKKTLVTITDEHQSEAIKNITLLYILFLLFVSVDESNKLNKNLYVLS